MLGTTNSPSQLSFSSVHSIEENEDDSFSYCAPSFYDFAPGAPSPSSGDEFFEGKRSSIGGNMTMTPPRRLISPSKMEDEMEDVHGTEEEEEKSRQEVAPLSPDFKPVVSDGGSWADLRAKRVREPDFVDSNCAEPAISNEEAEPEDKRRKVLNSPQKKNSRMQTRSSSRLNKSLRAELTKPKSPQFRTSQRIKPVVSTLSTEELEVQRIEEEKKQLEKSRLEAKERMAKALQGGTVRNHSSVERKVTIPEPFQLRSESRLRTPRDNQENGMKKDGLDNSKQNAKSSCSGPGELTKPKPFKFLTDERIMIAHNNHPEPTSSPYQPLAIRVQKFLTETPERYRTRSRASSISSDSGSSSNSFDSSDVQQRDLTQPKPFSFHTDERIRGPRVKSSSELEEEELQKCQPFKARPLDRRILESAGDLGVPRVPKASLTEPQEFRFQTDSRAESIRTREARDLVVEETKPFKARAVMEGVPQFKAKESVVVPELTIPKSPKLSTRERSARRTSSLSGSSNESVVQFKARPMPVSEAWVPQKAEHKPAEFAEFHLRTDERGEQYRRELEKKLQDEEEQRRRDAEFHARPLYEDSGEFVNFIPSTGKCTEPQPFRLMSEELHAEAKARLEAKIREQEEMELRVRDFHARPFNKNMSPHLPAVKPLPLTQVTEFHLNSDDRAEQRKVFDEHVKEKFTAIEKQKQQEEEEEKEREAEEIKRIRKESQFKAKPVAHFKEFVLRESNIPLTEPHTPNLRTRHRAVHMR